MIKMQLLLKDKNYDKETYTIIQTNLNKLPLRFKRNYLEMMYECEQDAKSAIKNTEYFLDDIMNELNEEEKERIFNENSSEMKSIRTFIEEQIMKNILSGDIRI